MIGKHAHALVFALASLTATALADTWEQTGTLAAPEAIQAAAADERFVFAIASQVVAKYDRATGQLVAKSKGESHHLNSGFLWEGKLYCAHSNYPQTPEQSEIKVLDPGTMQLSTYKDLGDFGGSLTWAVRRDGHWWCNFAHYGRDNAKTFLVKFDDNWKELGRWTYPQAVIGEIGSYSLSGGIWRGDLLFTTDHDHGVLYCLRLPKQGTTLEFVEQQPAPFTGQGIAHDSKTGGLVGISRAKRQVLFATLRTNRLRILSYNIHHGEGVDGKLDLDRIARVIRSVNPDLVALQEVDYKTTRTKQVNQPAELARLSGMQVVFGKNIDLQGGGYGNAILSRWPLSEHQHHQLPCFDKGEQRGVLVAPVTPAGWSEPVPFLATHLDHRRDDKERLASAKQINELVARSGSLAILAGDLNAGPETPVLATFRKQWVVGEKESPTVPVTEPKRQIDFVLFRPAKRWRVVETRVLEEAVASDHRAILVVLELVP